MVGSHSNRIRYVQLKVWNDAGRYRRYRDVENCADQQRADDTYRHVALGILCLLRRRADGVEANVGEKHDTSALHHAVPSVMAAHTSTRWDERMPVSGINGVSGAEDKEQDDCHFYKYDNVIDVRGLTNPDHEKQCNDSNDDDRRQIEDGGDLRSIRHGNECPPRGR